MRRLTVELPLPDIERYILTGDLPIQQMESLEVLHFLRQDPKEYSVIARIAFKDPAYPLKDMLPFGCEMQILDRDKDGAYTVFIKGKSRLWSRSSRVMTVGGYVSPPVEIIDGRVRLTFLGNNEEVRAFLQLFQRAGARCNVISVEDANFSSASPLNRLTEKQRRVLITSYRMGYYDLPRRASSTQVAQKLHVGSSTLVAHRRKAERRLLTQVLKEA
jgi:hypothetical protein